MIDFILAFILIWVIIIVIAGFAYMLYDIIKDLKEYPLFDSGERKTIKRYLKITFYITIIIFILLWIFGR